MPVATQGTVKSLTPADFLAAGAQIVLSNTYHLLLRPGHELVRELGGLHRFMGWDGPILTDSGGFQVWSLSDLRRIGEEGVEFRSHVDGSLRTLTPESVVAVQHALGVDVLHPLDECLDHPATAAETERSLALTLRWLHRAVAAHRAAGAPGALFGIVQGGTSPALRVRAVEETCALDLPGYAIGGLAVGEPKPDSTTSRSWWPRACPPPVRATSWAWASPGIWWKRWPAASTLRLRDADAQRAQRPGLHPGRAAQHRERPLPARPGAARPRVPVRGVPGLLAGLSSPSVRRRELLGYRLLSLHNLTFYLGLMRQMREAVAKGDFAAFRSRFLERYGAAAGGVKAGNGAD